MNTNIRRIVLVIMMSVFASLSTWAFSPKSTIILKNGSKIVGDIIVQRPGVDLTIEGIKAELVFNESNVRSIHPQKVRYEKLPREWQRWVLENKALIGDAYGRYLEMYDVKTKNNNYTRLAKVKRDDGIKEHFLQVEKSIYKFEWDMIDEILRTTPTDETVTGVDDEVISIYGKQYRGTITSQKVGKNITIKTNKGSVELKMHEIIETKSVPRSSSFTITEQADYTNAVVMNDGIVKEGIIVAKHYGKNVKGQYITLLNDNGKKENILMSEVGEYRTQYKNKEEDIYKEGAIYVNEFRINKAKVITDNGVKCYVEKKIYPFPEGIVITFKNRGTVLSGAWHLIALENITMNDGSSTYGYDNNTKNSNSISPSSTDFVDGISSITFAYLSPGYYSLVNDNSNNSYIIKIVK